MRHQHCNCYKCNCFGFNYFFSLPKNLKLGLTKSCDIDTDNFNINKIHSSIYWNNVYDPVYVNTGCHSHEYEHSPDYTCHIRARGELVVKRFTDKVDMGYLGPGEFKLRLFFCPTYRDKHLELENGIVPVPLWSPFIEEIPDEIRSFGNGYFWLGSKNEYLRNHFDHPHFTNSSNTPLGSSTVPDFDNAPVFVIDYTNSEKFLCEDTNTLTLQSIYTNDFAVENGYEEPDFPDTIDIVPQHNIKNIYLVFTNGEDDCLILDGLENWMDFVDRSRGDYEIVEVTAKEPILGYLGIESHVIQDETWYIQRKYALGPGGSCDCTDINSQQYCNGYLASGIVELTNGPQTNPGMSAQAIYDVYAGLKTENRIHYLHFIHLSDYYVTFPDAQYSGTVTDFIPPPPGECIPFADYDNRRPIKIGEDTYKDIAGNVVSNYKAYAHINDRGRANSIINLPNQLWRYDHEYIIDTSYNRTGRVNIYGPDYPWITEFRKILTENDESVYWTTTTARELPASQAWPGTFKGIYNTQDCGENLAIYVGNTTLYCPEHDGDLLLTVERNNEPIISPTITSVNWNTNDGFVVLDTDVDEYNDSLDDNIDFLNPFSYKDAYDRVYNHIDRGFSILVSNDKYFVITRIDGNKLYLNNFRFGNKLYEFSEKENVPETGSCEIRRLEDSSCFGHSALGSYICTPTYLENNLPLSRSISGYDDVICSYYYKSDSSFISEISLYHNFAYLFTKHGHRYLYNSDLVDVQNRDSIINYDEIYFYFRSSFNTSTGLPENQYCFLPRRIKISKI